MCERRVGGYRFAHFGVVCLVLFVLRFVFCVSTAKRLRPTAQGCRFGYPGFPQCERFNRNAVASNATHGRFPITDATRSGLKIFFRVLTQG